jgi:hypothetical protein
MERVGVDTIGSDGNGRVQVRVRMSDHPGSLGRVARELGEAGADIVQVVVLEQGGGQAVDDFVVSCPSGDVRDRLPDMLGAIPGVRVEGVWRALAVTGAALDVELLGRIAAAPGSGLKALVEAVPDLFAGRWAALVDLAGEAPASARVVCASRAAPGTIEPAVLETVRLSAVALRDGLRVAVVPVGRPERVLVVARIEAPPFHPTEISRLALLAHVAASLV